VPTSKGEGREGNGKRKGKGWQGGREGGKGRTPVTDCESAKVATLKCGGPPTMPEENRGPWSKKFENRCVTGRKYCYCRIALLLVSDRRGHFSFCKPYFGEFSVIQGLTFSFPFYNMWLMSQLESFASLLLL